MTQILTADDAFTENSPVYGDWLTGYARFNPWEAAGSGGESATGYSIRNNAVCQFHDGYRAVTTNPPSTSGAFRANLSAPTRAFCSMVWRPYFAANCTVSAAFVPHVVAGNKNTSSWGYAGVCARASGSPTFDSTSGSERIINGDSYWFLLASNSSDTKFLLLRVNGGTVTLLDSTSVAAPKWERPIELSLSVVTTAGNPVLTAQAKYYPSGGVSYPLGADGSPAPDTIFSYTDSSVSKITASGRCGFGSSQDHNQSSGAIKTVTLIPWFQIHDTSSDEVVHRDEWQRSSRQILGTSTADTLSVSGSMLHSAWIGDQASFFTRTLARDSGSNRITISGPGTINDFISTRPASNRYYQDRECTFNLSNPSSTNCFAGMTLRCSWPTGFSVAASGYRFIVKHTGSVWSATLSRVNSSGVSQTLAQNTDLSSFSLSTGTNFTLGFKVSNFGGTNETNGTPLLVATINGTSPAWTNLVGLSATVQADNSVLHNGFTPDLLQGSCEGFIAIPGASATLRVDTWHDVIPATPDISADEMEGIVPTYSEGYGATGTLTLAYDWPVEEERIYRIMEHRYDSRHAQRMPWCETPRRRWRVRAAAATSTERDDIKDFFDDHRGPEIPFTWVEPNGETITAHFVDEDLDLVLIAPGVYSFDFQIEEVDR